MSSTPESAKTPAWMFWTGWVVSALPALGLVVSGVMKLVKPEMIVKEFARLGYHDDVVIGLGIVEITCTAIYLIPRTGALGAILLTGYLGGAVATHLRIGDPYYGPIVFGVLVWLGLYLRDSRLRAILPRM